MFFSSRTRGIPLQTPWPDHRDIFTYPYIYIYIYISLYILIYVRIFIYLHIITYLHIPRSGPFWLYLGPDFSSRTRGIPLQTPWPDHRDIFTYPYIYIYIYISLYILIYVRIFIYLHIITYLHIPRSGPFWLYLGPDLLP